MSSTQKRLIQTFVERMKARMACGPHTYIRIIMHFRRKLSYLDFKRQFSRDEELRLGVLTLRRVCGENRYDLRHHRTDLMFWLMQKRGSG